MGILQKIFDKSAESLEKSLDKFDPYFEVTTAKEAFAAARQHPVTTVKLLAAGVTCEATGLASKILKKPLDTSNTSVTGKFF